MNIKAVCRALLAMLPMLAAQSLQAESTDETLVVYTYESFTSEWGPGPKIKAGFEQQCGNCTVEFVALDNSAGILNRVQLEGRSTRADVVLGLDTNLMALAEQSGLLSPHDIELPQLELPIEWDSSIFVPYDFGWFAFIVDTQALPNPPTSFRELADAPDSLKFIMQDPRTSTPGLGLMLWVKAAYGEQAAELWAELEPHVLTVSSSWSESYFTLFMNGEAPLVLSYSTSPAYHMVVDNEDRWQAVAFEEGHYLQVEVAAILEQSPRKPLARKFLSYLLSEEAQAMLPLTNVMYPVRDIGEALPEAFNHLISPSRTLLFDAETVAAQRRDWVDEWLDAMSR